MSKLLQGKKVIITGARRGIGKACVTVFAENGADIVALIRNNDVGFENFCKELSAKENVKVVPIIADITVDEEVKEAIKKTKVALGSIDILVNNAGIVPDSKLFQMTSIEDMKNVFEVNTFAQIRMMQYAARLMMRQKKGSIVNVASIAALDGGPAQLEYVASKAALVGATKKLSVELGEHGIRVNAVAPGMTDTEMVKEMREDIFQHALNNTVMKRLATPDEIANAILFLASELSSYVTGQILRVDGGFVR